MKYGIVNKEEWAENDAFPDESFCIAFLTNDGVLAQNAFVIDRTVGDGSVWIIRENGQRERLGYFPLPMDIRYFGAFDTEQDAIKYYEDKYINDLSELERDINIHVTLNEDIDDYVESSIVYKKINRYIWIIISCIVVIVLVLLLIRLKQLGYHLP